MQRSARFYLLGPARGAEELWVACHGYGQLARAFAQALRPIDDGTRLVLVPEALNRFYLDDPAARHGPHSPVGATWMTREDREHEIDDYVAYLDAVTAEAAREHGASALPVTALGFSQGVATACRWAALGRTPVARLIMWAGQVPPDLPRDRGPALFRGASLVLVAGRRDPMVTAEAIEREQRTLADAGLEVRLVTFDGAHALNGDTLRRLASREP